MNRKIKLRVWDNHLKTMQEDAEQFHETITRLNDTTGRYIIEQWTGLMDKHGTRIFEGDVVRYSYGGYESLYIRNDPNKGIGPVFFENGAFRVKVETDNVIVFLEYMEESEVIGNIHASPDLIK